MSTEGPLVILGCGFTGRVLAARATSAGRVVIGTVRSEDAASALHAEGIDARVMPRLEASDVRTMLEGDGDLVVAFPPDGETDARLTSEPLGAHRIVYVSSTGVFGDARGDVDEDTPVAPDSERSAARLAAENAWRARGAIAIRAAGIYGPGRGIHERIARGAFRIPGDGTNVVSRIHVEDLASLIDAALQRAKPGSVYVAADDAPVPQIEAVRFICERLGVAMPAHIAVDDASETLRHDRRVRNARARRELGWAPRYPSYREGMGTVLAF